MTSRSQRTQDIVVRSVLPRISGTLSILGSSAILVSMLLDGGKKLRSSFNRLLFMMCCFDVIISFGHVWATSALPEDYDYYAHDAAGNLTTCRIQGFMLQLGMAVPIYFYFLTVHYLLVIRYGMKEERIRRTFEPLMHLFALTFAIGTATAGLILADNACWAASDPQDCFSDEDGDEDCVEHATIYVWIFAGIPAILPLFLVPFTMGLIFWTVRKQTLKMNRYKPSTLFHESTTRTTSTWRDSILASQSATRDNVSSALNLASISNLRRTIKSKTTERLKAVAHQGLAYSLCYMVVFVWPIIMYLFFMYSEDHVVPLFVAIMYNIFFPLQGFLNYIIYVRPFVIQMRKAHPEWSILRAMYVVTFPKRPHGGRNSVSICQELNCCKFDCDEIRITEISETDCQHKTKVDLDQDGGKDCDLSRKGEDPKEKEEAENDQSGRIQRYGDDEVERELVEALTRAASYRDETDETFTETEREIKQESEYFQAIIELSKITGNYS